MLPDPRINPGDALRNIRDELAHFLRRVKGISDADAQFLIAIQITADVAARNYERHIEGKEKPL